MHVSFEILLLLLLSTCQYFSINGMRLDESERICQAYSNEETQLNRTVKQHTNDSCNVAIPFYCSNGQGCISAEQFCDDHDDCSDKSDEEVYKKSIHGRRRGIPCQKLLPNVGLIKKCFLPEEYVGDSEMQCTLGEDECGSIQSFQCDSSPVSDIALQCVKRIHFCDGVKDCVDCADERPYIPGTNDLQCSVTKFHGTITCALPTRNICDGVSDCDEGIDECFCSNKTGLLIKDSFSNGRCFRCLDNTKIITERHVCDGKFDCPDLSDECMCRKKPEICGKICRGTNCDGCRIGEVSCPRSNSSQHQCIALSQVCDNNYDCPFRDDERNCIINTNESFICQDRSRYIRKNEQCDNVTDCDDGSDEANCSAIYFQCHEESYGYNNPVKRNAYETVRPRYTNSCDLTPFCEDLEDECNVTLCGPDLPEYCNYLNGNLGFICPISRSALIGTEVCDGYPTCSIDNPESSADELSCPNRFYCEDKGKFQLPIHIPESARCDGKSDCFDNSDELNCSLTTHFYCDSGPVKYVLRKKVCNGIQDCATGEDECQLCSVSPFSSDKFLIRSYALQVFIWIIGIASTIGNVVVLLYNFQLFWKGRKDMSTLSYNHRLLVVNLATADLLLGIYLIILGIVNQKFSGRYCQQDIQWRASKLCITMGTMAVISTECCIFLLVTMATMRLRLITKPFYSEVKRRYIFLWVIAAWVFAFVVALVPLSEANMDYFISQVWYNNNPFLTLTNRNDLSNVATYIWSLDDSTNDSILNLPDSRALTWNNMIDTVGILNETYRPSLYFGYYSAHGVCLPRLFPDPRHDRSWGFSLFLITFNFLAFAYMLIAYIAIYKITTSHSKNAGRSDMDFVTSNLQHKITRVIFTNFVCWIPICIMAFLSAAGYQLSPDAYAVSAIILLPINSAFNPLLYSDLPDLIWSKLIGNTAFGMWLNEKKLQRSCRRRTPVSFNNTYMDKKTQASSKTSMTNSSNAETKV